MSNTSAPPSSATTSTWPTCRFFPLGRCKNGNNCNFSHSVSSAQPSSSSSPSPPPPSSTSSSSASFTSTPCKFFLSGYCLRGNSCWYAHESPAEEILDKPVASAPGSAEAEVPADEKGKGREVPSPRPTYSTDSVTSPGNNNRGTEATTKVKQDEDRTCAICFDPPTTYGLLSSCDHVFCLECIREWRRNRPAPSSLFQPATHGTLQENPSKACPLCRKPSPFVFPSSVFPATSQHKQHIMANYRRACASKPCKYFERSSSTRRECPFGDECFFRHAENHAPHVRVTVQRPNRQSRRRAAVHDARQWGLEWGTETRLEEDDIHGLLQALMLNRSDDILSDDIDIEVLDHMSDDDYLDFRRAFDTDGWGTTWGGNSWEDADESTVYSDTVGVIEADDEDVDSSDSETGQNEQRTEGDEGARTTGGWWDDANSNCTTSTTTTTTEAGGTRDVWEERVERVITVPRTRYHRSRVR